MENITRKEFLQVAGLGAAGVAAASMVGNARADETAPEAAVPAWLGEEPAYDDSQISETLEADVVVVGAGV